MSDIRPELSKSNSYRIPKHRYYELKHFVQQYPDWDLAVVNIDSMVRSCRDHEGKITNVSDPVWKAVLKRSEYTKNIQLCKDIADDTDPVLGRTILQAIILGESYDKIKARTDIPCCKDVYYDLYHKFFWLLDAARK